VKETVDSVAYGSWENCSVADEHMHITAFSLNNFIKNACCMKTLDAEILDNHIFTVLRD
jgi:hypothetical protein